MLGLKIRRTTKLEETLCSYIYIPHTSMTLQWQNWKKRRLRQQLLTRPCWPRWDNQAMQFQEGMCAWQQGVEKRAFWKIGAARAWPTGFALLDRLHVLFLAWLWEAHAWRNPTSFLGSTNAHMPAPPHSWMFEKEKWNGCYISSRAGG